MIKRLFPLPLALLLAAPTLAFESGGFEDPNQINRYLLAAMPAPSANRFWVQVRQPVLLADLAHDLQISSGILADLNDVGAQHRFDRGDWVLIPSQQFQVAKQLAVLDASSLRRAAPPLTAPPPANKRQTSADIASEIHRRKWAGFVAIGSCSYDWSGWKLDARGVRSTRYRCSYDNYRDDKWIAVDCKSLKTAKNFGAGWSLWKLPSDSDEVSVVARLCANTVGGTPKTDRRQQVVECYPSDSLRCRIEALDRLSLPTENSQQRQTDSSKLSSWAWPTYGIFIAGYGWRDGQMYSGIDIANDTGTPILAARGGRVVFADWGGEGHGYLVALEHPDGSRSLYAHNSRLMVRVGEIVSQGSVISLMGSTGRSGRPYLHFQIHLPDVGPANPLRLLPPRA